MGHMELLRAWLFWRIAKTGGWSPRSIRCAIFRPSGRRCTRRRRTTFFRLPGAENPAGGLTKQIRDMAPLSPLMRGGAFVRETFNPLRGWQDVKQLRNWERGVAANPTSSHLFPKSNSRLAAKRWGFVDSVFFQRISLRTSRWKLRTYWGSLGATYYGSQAWGGLGADAGRQYDTGFSARPIRRASQVAFNVS